MQKTVVCPGSFDPVTLGHLDIIRRTASIFDKVIVVVMTNYRKKNLNYFTAEERADFIRRCTVDLPNVTVDFSDGLLADYVKKVGACAIVKGLRAVSDFEDEFQQALTNKTSRCASWAATSASLYRLRFAKILYLAFTRGSKAKNNMENQNNKQL